MTHRSHFGSRYKSGCCGHAGLIWHIAVRAFTPRCIRERTVANEPAPRASHDNLSTLLAQIQTLHASGSLPGVRFASPQPPFAEGIRLLFAPVPGRCRRSLAQGALSLLLRSLANSKSARVLAPNSQLRALDVQTPAPAQACQPTTEKRTNRRRANCCRCGRSGQMSAFVSTVRRVRPGDARPVHWLVCVGFWTLRCTSFPGCTRRPGVAQCTTSACSCPPTRKRIDVVAGSAPNETKAN